MCDYETNARGVAQSIGLKVNIKLHPQQKCPLWSKPCNHKHGLRYLVTLENTRRDHLTFSFWDSLHNQVNGMSPTIYDVLSCVSSDVNLPTDPDKILEELGPMKPSQAIATAEHAKKLQAFFTRSEHERLSEIS